MAWASKIKHNHLFRFFPSTFEGFFFAKQGEHEGRLKSTRLCSAGGEPGESEHGDPDCELTVLGLELRHSPWRSSSISLCPQRALPDPYTSLAAGKRLLSSIIDTAASHDPCQPPATRQRSLKGQRTPCRQSGRHVTNGRHNFSMMV